jgi:hypothetical protein
LFENSTVTLFSTPLWRVPGVPVSMEAGLNSSANRTRKNRRNVIIPDS